MPYDEEMSVGYLAFMVLKLTIDAAGLMGNALCGIVLFQKDMRSSYNYLLMGLTLSDAMALILSALWSLDNLEIIDLSSRNVGPLQTFIFFWDWLCTGGTKYFTVAVSLERFFVVCYPLKARQAITPKRSKLFALGVLTFIILVSICSFVYHYYLDSKSYEIYTAVILHFTPFAAVLLLNGLIFTGLRRFQKERKSLTESEASEVSITRMLLTVVFVFGFCYSFEFTRRILNYAGYIDETKYPYYDYNINRLADIFYDVNSSVNFIIYYLLGNKFRAQFLRLFKIVFSWVPGFCGSGRSIHNSSNTSKTSKTTLASG